ncbi:MAG TPA: SDR family NAD(P)-dependent oxidoreductase [Acidimicrobiia bacterium]|nr:SDR family NAD(P)-dependent oxidoreductase [Acidimicrobiia bacterium]
MQIKGSKALITGGGSGLGEATARRLAAAGATVALLDLPSSRGAEVAGQIGGHFVVADVTVPAEVAAAVDAAAGAMGGIHLCLNAAGIASAHRVVTRTGEMFPLELYEKVIRVNLIGTFDVTRHVARRMAENTPTDDGERGVIVNVASIAATEGQIGQAAYSASKGGVAAMTLPLARDLASYGIRVNTIAPGIMETPMISGMTAEVRESLAQVHVFPKRLGRPTEFAALVQHLFENTLINGETIRLDAAARMGPR